MITKEQYLDAEKIVNQYHQEQSTSANVNHVLQKGDKVIVTYDNSNHNFGIGSIITLISKDVDWYAEREEKSELFRYITEKEFKPLI